MPALTTSDWVAQVALRSVKRSSAVDAKRTATTELALRTHTIRSSCLRLTPDQEHQLVPEGKAGCVDLRRQPLAF
jgi:hypothetical protein